LPYRQFYEIYPNKKCVNEKPGACLPCIDKIAKATGRTIDPSRGDSLKQKKNMTPQAAPPARKIAGKWRIKRSKNRKLNF
jgi:hypothetical protein